ncbi:MAG: gamma-glutamyl-gamma-aminobutyrate hydrolase family protein [Candidatus Zixiibacteriota bacterium]
MDKPPLICLTLRGQSYNEGRRDPTPYAYEWLPSAFGAAIAAAGGVPIGISNECPTAQVASVLDHVDGLFLTGGEDVAPEHFGEHAEVDNLTINPERDRVELAAIAAADSLGLPILGVCRGIQVLNVARGGTLYQDLGEQYPQSPRDHSRGGSGLYVQTHAVDVAPGCRLQSVLKAARVAVATSHHQAIKSPGRGLVVTAHAPEDGVIEAVEEVGDRFVVGVQWHPEVRPDDDATVRLFRAFVEAAQLYSARRRRMTGSLST